MVVLVGQIGEEARHRRPDAVALEHVQAVQRGEAVGLPARELERVRLLEDLLHGIDEPHARRLTELLQAGLVAGTRAATIELLQQLLLFTRGPEVPADLHRKGHRGRPLRGLAGARAAESLVHLVLVAVRDRIESAHEEQRAVRLRVHERAPALQATLAVDETVETIERVGHLERDVRALRQPELERVERDVQVTAHRPRPFAGVASRELSQLAADACRGFARAGGKETLEPRLERRIGRKRGRIEHEGAIVAVAVAVHVLVDRGRVVDARAEVAEPRDAHGVPRVVAQRVLDLMAREVRATRPLDAHGGVHRAVEAEKLLAHVREHVRKAPTPLGVEHERAERGGELLALRLQFRRLRRDTAVLRKQSGLAPRHLTRGRNDGPGRHVHRAVPLAGQREALLAGEVDVDAALLTLIAREGGVHREIESVLQDGALPPEVAAQGALGIVVGEEKRHVRGAVGEHRARGAVGTGARDIRHVGRVRRPIGDRSGGPDAGELLQPRRQTGVVDRVRDQLRARRVLEEADTAADDGPRRADHAGQQRHLIGLAHGPREAESRAHVDAVGHLGVVVAELGQHVRVGLRPHVELVAVHAYPVLYLQVVRGAPRITQRHGGHVLTALSAARRQQAGERGRPVVLQVG